jgi:hypothetical protein
MLQSIGKVNLSIVVILYGQNKQPARATKRLQRQNRTEYEAIVEDIRLQLTQVM